MSILGEGDLVYPHVSWQPRSLRTDFESRGRGLFSTVDFPFSSISSSTDCDTSTKSESESCTHLTTLSSIGRRFGVSRIPYAITEWSSGDSVRIRVTQTYRSWPGTRWATEKEARRCQLLRCRIPSQPPSLPKHLAVVREYSDSIRLRWALPHSNGLQKSLPYLSSSLSQLIPAYL